MQQLTPDLLSEERLKKSVDEETYLIGLDLYQKKRVSILELSETNAICLVDEARPQKVEIILSPSHLYLKCNCSHASRGLVCEHGVASWLFVRDHLRKNDFPQWRHHLSLILEHTRTGAEQKKSQPYLLFFSLQETGVSGFHYFEWVPYIITLTSVDKETKQKLSTATPEEIKEFITEHSLLRPRLKIPNAALTLDGCLNLNNQMVTLANVMISQERNFSNGTTFDDFLLLFSEAQTPVYLGTEDNPLETQLQLVTTQGELRLSISRNKNEILIQPRIVIGDHYFEITSEEFTFVYPSNSWGKLGNIIFPVKNRSAFEALEEIYHSPLRIPEFQEKDFLDKYLVDLARQFVLEGNLVSFEEVAAEPVPRLYLTDQSGEIQAQLRFGYANTELLFDSTFPETSQIHKEGTWKLERIVRKPEAEEAASKKLSSASFGLKRAPLAAQPGLYRLRARTHPVDFLLHRLPKIAEDGFEIYGEQQLRTARVNRQAPTISFSVSSEIDWFDVQAIVNFGELQVSLKDIRKALRKRERFIKLDDGSIGEIPEEWLDKYRYLWGLAETSEKGFRLSHHHLALIEDMLSSADDKKTDAVYDQKRTAFSGLSQPDFKGIPSRPLPLEFTGELRPYQKAGYDWLHFLSDYQLGGCLADDMGLGKTIQALVFLQDIYAKDKQKDKNRRASLLVVPKSLLINWQREAARFTPQLRFLEYFAFDRNKNQEEFADTDLVITTYGVMLRDISHLHAYRFEYIILDESQAIKNPASQTARAARLLQGNHRLVLTGTPVENSTVELWSQFAFLNPGLLGSLDYFKSEFASPIERKNDQQVLDSLRRLVYPFILRRTKDQVAPELPPRTERILTCDMEPAQRKLYNRTRDYYRGMVLGLIDKGDWSVNQIKILEGLLRLRQISNHPVLFDEKFRGESGKFSLLFETLETLRSEGHKVLVFSQFVQMLSLVRRELDKNQVPYTYLDGQTQNRQGQVDLFQNDPHIPFFLISLKAGGIGLNLTAADYVIHIDPWWNPAVEMQASDRTHRIGQEKPVFVFKLITQDSVEEKILMLQERKRNLVEQLITTESSFFKSLSEDDLQVLFS